MAIPLVRDISWNAVVTWHERYISVAFETDTDTEFPETIKKRQMPQLPEGWTMKVIGESEIGGFYSMTGPEEKRVVFRQNVYTGREQRFDNTDCEIQEIILNDHMEAVLMY